MTDKDFERALHRIYSDPDLRRFILALARRCGYGTTTFTPNALTSAYTAGRQSIINELVADFNSTDPAFWPGLLKEQNDDDRTDD
jgi:hypothetical protein